MEAGHEIVAIMAPAEAPIPAGDGIKRLPLPKVSRHFWPNSGLFNLLLAALQRARSSLVALYQALHERPAVCLCQEPDSWLVGLFVKLLTRSALVVDMQEIYEVKAGAFPLLVRRQVARVIRQLMILLAKRTDQIIHVSGMRQSYYSFLSTPVTIVENTPPLEEFSAPCPSRDPELEGRFVIIHAGPLRPHYAAKELLLAIEKTAHAIPGVLCVVTAGMAGVSADCDELLRGLQREKRLILLPVLPYGEVVQYMKMSDVGITLELNIGINYEMMSPRKLFEYMAAGLPVIGADAADVRRIIVEEDCGFVVDSTSPESIANAIVRMASDFEGRERMATNALRAAERTYNWSQAVLRLRRVFSELERDRSCGSPV
jgi:glycosyltransferase involved in cell wall biosynthesis